MLVVCSPIFMADTKIIFRYDFVAPLKDFPHMILNDRVQDKMSGFDT